MSVTNQDAIQQESTRIECACSKQELKWFAAYTATHHEKCVFDHLNERHVESFLPLYEARRQWKKRTPVTLSLPLFPNYIFVHISPRERAAVLGTPGVFAIVGSGSTAWELPEREIEVLRHGLNERRVEPHEYLVVGERARVTSGILVGLEGVIIVRKSNLHIVLSLDQIARSIAIEVDASELEPIFRAGNPKPLQDRPPQPNFEGSIIANGGLCHV